MGQRGGIMFEDYDDSYYYQENYLNAEQQAYYDQLDAGYEY